MERARRWQLGAGLAVVVGLAGVGFWRIGQRNPECGAALRQEDLAASLRLGSQYVLAHQKAVGNFDYEYDWRTHKTNGDDNEVRQAGALWGLALLAAAPPALRLSPELRPAAWRGLRFFDAHAGETAAGGRYPIYQSAAAHGARGAMGTAALVTLALVELLRGGDLAADERATWDRKLDAYLRFLVSARNADGLWFGEYDLASGTPMGEPSPYADGEALLALTKAAKYLGRKDLAPTVRAAARAGHELNVVAARAAMADSDVTKGYYQWSSMALGELATSEWAADAPYGEWLLDAADWIVGVHEILVKRRNTGYAYEGLVPALAYATAQGDRRAPQLACVVDTGLGRLMTWQVGHPLAVQLGPTDDALAVGGVQNAASEPGLRIDVVQHQMHGTLMAWEWLQRPAEAR